MNFRNRKVVRTIQIIFGLWLILTTLGGLFRLFPAPQFNETGMAFLVALFSTGYMMYLMQAIFILSGLMFIFNRWSAFGALLLAPVTLNIFLFHVFLDFEGFWMALIFTLLNVYLLIVHWSKYKPIFDNRF